MRGRLKLGQNKRKRKSFDREWIVCWYIVKRAFTSAPIALSIEVKKTNTIADLWIDSNEWFYCKATGSIDNVKPTSVFFNKLQKKKKRQKKLLLWRDTVKDRNCLTSSKSFSFKRGFFHRDYLVFQRFKISRFLY